MELRRRDLMRIGLSGTKLSLKNRIALGAAPALRTARVVRLTAAVLSAVTAYVHFAYTESHFEEWWAYGVLFLLAGQLQAVLALALLRRPPAWVLAGGALVNLGIVGVYVLSRTSGLPFGPHANVAERAGAVDLGTTAAEIVLVGLLVALLGTRALTMPASELNRPGTSRVTPGDQRS